MKLRCKKILCWYCYYKAYENQVRNVKSKNGIDDKSARILVYSEIKFFLPDITNVNLCKITFRAKKIYILFDRIGINRIQIISCSASAILNLHDNQIQDIINDFSKKVTNTDDVGYEDSVPIWNEHVTLKTNKTDALANPLGVSTSANILSSPQSKPTYDTLMTNPIFATRYWINILIYIENVVVKISIIMGLLMRHHAGTTSAHYAN